MKNEQLILSGFSDESANQKTMDQQFSAMTAMGLQYVSLRFVDAGSGTKNLMELDEFEIDRVATKLEEYHLRVSSIGSPIGKVKLLNVDDGTMNRFVPFQEYLQTEVQKACDLAVRFGSKLIRGFSFYHPKGKVSETYVSLRLPEKSRLRVIPISGLHLYWHLSVNSRWMTLMDGIQDSTTPATWRTRRHC